MLRRVFASNGDGWFSSLTLRDAGGLLCHQEIMQ